jgi:CspA family cold shock protein
MTQGTVKFYNADKWFGFIIYEGDQGEQQVFFHISKCAEWYTPNQGDQVSFSMGAGRDGRPAAEQIQPL